MNRKIYLDNNATTPCLREVFAEMEPYFCERYGNASSAHSAGREARLALEKARERVASLINSTPEEIIFCSGGTEANNHAIKKGFELCPDKVIICSEIEHSSVISVCKNLINFRVEVSYLPTNANGIVDIDAFEKIAGEKKGMLILMLANNETGAIQPVSEIAKIAKSKGWLVFSDAIQAAGKMEIDVEMLGIDLLSLSAHKFFGPKGVGALYVRRGVKLPSLLHGGGQERMMRSGTENVAGIVGMGKAAELAKRDLRSRIDFFHSLREEFLEFLRCRISNFRVNTPLSRSIENTINISFKGVASEALVTRLDLDGICVSSASACSGLTKVSHVLRAMRVGEEYLYSALRISFGIMNTKEEILEAVEVIARRVEELRRLRG